MRDAGLEPLVEYPGTDRRWTSRCTTCGAVVYPTLTNVGRLGRGCRWCAAYGIKWNEPYFVYLLEHGSHLSFKVGVAAQVPLTEPRVHRLCRRYGWCLIGTVRTATGKEAFDVEQAVLGWVRHNLGLPQHLTSDETEGATETFSSDLVGSLLVLRRIRAEVAAWKGEDLGQA